MTNPSIPKDEIRSIVNYNPETGIFTWKVGRRRCRKDAIAGNIQANSGYWRIGINRKRYNASRLAFMFMGYDIPEEVDHINGNRADNRWVNLRAVTSSENSRNLSIPKNNTSGHMGVRWISRLNKWRAEIWLDKNKYLGIYETFAEACAARKKAEVEYGFHANHGRDHAANP